MERIWAQHGVGRTAHSLPYLLKKWPVLIRPSLAGFDSTADTFNSVMSQTEQFARRTSILEGNFIAALER
jgi:hypothetical protein